MKPLEARAKRAVLLVMSLERVLVSFTKPRIVGGVHRTLFRDQRRDLRIQSVALVPESLSFRFSVDVHAAADLSGG
jgi:hypothetical protein